VIPPGRNNLQPDVSLAYNSSDNQLRNIFGEGWSVNIPYIERINKAGVDKLYSTSTTNYFRSSLDGELATTSVASTYVPRTENGAFNHYVFSSNAWTVTDKNGTQFTFGTSTDSVQNDPNNTGNVYRWLLKQVRDTNNNYITYNYFKDAGQVYPSSVLYTGNGSTDGPFEVDFLRTSSTDNATSSGTGFVVHSNYRINEIDAKVSGTWVRKYALAYTTADNGSTTLLSSITQSGRDSLGNVVTLPAVTFSYQGHTAGWTSSSTWASPMVFSVNGNDIGNRLVDVKNGELSDIISGYVDLSGVGHYDAYINNNHGWTENTSWNPSSTPFSNFGSDTGWRLADVNGDGLPDLIRGYQDSAFGFYHDAYLNTGSGWTHNASWAPPVIFSHAGNDTGWRIADVNGDGLPDLIYSYMDSNFNTYHDAYINTGSGWVEDTSWNPPVIFSNAGKDTGFRIADVNGDGLPDIIYGYTDGANVYHDAFINNGHGWTEDTSWNPPAVFSNSGTDTGFRIADVNGDGLPDIIYAIGDGSGAHYDAFINNGHGWTENASWSPPRLFVNGGADYGSVIGDVNGDGLPDVIYGYTDNNTISTYGGYLNNTTVHPDLLTGVTYAQGGNSAITYKSAMLYTDGSGNATNKAPYPVYVVSQITTNDGSATATSLSYQYAGGTYYYNNPFDKQFAGFTTVTQTDAAGNVTKTYYHTGNGTDSTHGEYADNFWKIGKPYRVENYDNVSHLYKKTINKWDSVSLGGNAAFAKLAQTVASDYDGLSTHRDTAEAYTYDNTTGNQTEKIQWGEVTASDDGTFTDTGSDKFTTDSSFVTSTTGVIGKPYDVTVTDQSGTKVKETRYYYDTLSLGSASLGNLTKEEDWKTASTYINTQNTYNGYGLVTQTQDPRGKQTNYSYDTYNLYPATVTNALSQATQYLYDYSTGKPVQTTDPNGDMFQSVFDGLGRTLQVLQPDTNTSSTLVTKATYAYTGTANAVSVHESDYLSGSASVDTYSYYDGLNRLIQTRKSAEDSGTYKVTDRVYNNVGLLQKESLPYFASGSGKSAPTNTTTLLVTYSYDPLGRVLTIVNALGTTSNVYTNWKIATTDARGKEKDAYDDAYGNLIRVDEHNNGSTYSTYYTYDGLKDLTNITDALGNVRNFTYDGLGRRLTAQDLHASGASSYGTWNYTYDDAGNLTQQVDPKSQTITYVYDNLNRGTSESLGGVAQITYTYDTCTQGVGRLCTASSSAAVVSDVYNGVGELSQETKTIASTAYATSYTYDRQGNQLSITNPDNSQVQYTYNLAGLPETVSAKENGGSFVIVVSNFDYSPTDQPSVIAYANGVTQTNSYDATKLYRLTQKVGALPGGSNAENMSYTYDAVGNITQLVDASASGTGKTVNYTYDDLSRMTVASTTNVSTTPSYAQTFAYDALGNITSGPSGTYSYSGSNNADPDAVTSVGSSTFAYDMNGNLTSFASSTNTWNYRNRLTQSVNPSATSTYAYDYQDNRVKLVENGATTIFPNKFFNVMPGGLATSTKHIFADGLLLATVTDASSTTSTMRYVLDDSLGGANVITDASGTIAETLDYYPYGQARLDTTTGSYAGEKRKFIGQEYDAGSGFDYLNARYYDGTRGQFISEDPVFLAVGAPLQVKQVTGQDQQVFLSDPQQMNAYSYARDNPIAKSDPTGKIAPAALLIPAAIGAAYGIINEYGQNVAQNIDRGETGFAALNPNLSAGGYQKYVASAALDAGVATVGAISVVAAIPLYFGSSLVMQKVNNPQQPVNYVAAGFDTTLTAVAPVGVDAAFGKIAGPEISTLTSRVFSSVHVARDAQVETLVSELKNAAAILPSLVTSYGNHSSNNPQKKK
jgi:RHS repeat-associated protein